MITLKSLFHPGQHEFMAMVNDLRHVVIPKVEDRSKENARPIPVMCRNLAHDLFTEYNTYNHEHEIYLYASVGGYAGYKGPQLRHQEIEVTPEVLGTLFHVKMWQRSRGSLWSKRCHLADVQDNMKDGWFLEPPPEKIEDQEFITVSRDGQVCQERNPFYVAPPAEA